MPLQRPLNSLNLHVARASMRSQTRCHGNGNLITDRNISPKFQVAQVPNAYGAAILFNGRISFDFANSFFRVAQPSVRPNVPDHLNHISTTRLDGNITGPGFHIEIDRPTHLQSALER